MALAAQPLASARSSDFARRAIVLTLLFAIATAVSISLNAPQVEVKPHFPTDNATYTVDGWSVGPERVEGRPGVAFVTREFRRADGAIAQVNLTTSPQAKLVYRASADVPFLGNGYTVEPAPVDLVAPSANRTAQIARRGGEAWLQIAAYGERRGVFGNGPIGWGLAVFDLVLGRPNDYYLARVLVPFDGTSGSTASQIADTLLPRLAAWYL